MCCIRFAAQFFINNNISFVTHWITERYTWISSLMALSMPIFYIPLLPQCLWSWTIAQWLCMIHNSKYSLFIIYRTLLYYSLVLFDYDKNQSKYYFNKYWNFNFNKKNKKIIFFSWPHWGMSVVADGQQKAQEGVNLRIWKNWCGWYSWRQS